MVMTRQVLLCLPLEHLQDIRRKRLQIWRNLQIPPRTTFKNWGEILVIEQSNNYTASRALNFLHTATNQAVQLPLVCTSCIWMAHADMAGSMQGPPILLWSQVMRFFNLTISFSFSGSYPCRWLCRLTHCTSQATYNKQSYWQPCLVPLS